MKNTRFFRLALVLFAGISASQWSASAATDRAAELLDRRGSISVSAAGAHVERGTLRIQVIAKLGRPDVRIDNDTWLYHDREVEGSTARGTLVVRFAGGRVNSLAVVTPAVVAALRAAPPNGRAKEFVAAR